MTKLGRAKSDTRESVCFIHYRLASYDMAVAECDAALKVNAKLGYALYVCGLAKRRLGDTPAGVADIAAAKKLEADVVEVFAGFGVKP